MGVKTELIYFNNTKLFKVIRLAGSKTKIAKNIAVNVIPGINTSCKLWNMQSDTNISITNLDKLIIEAVGSIWEVSHTFTINDVVSTMFGNYRQRKFSSTLIKHVEESIDKMSDIDIIIDCSEEFAKRGINIEMTQTKLLRLTKDNKKYTLKEVPALMTYAKAISQYITLKADDLRMDKAFTENNALINRFLLTRIMQIKNNKNYLTKPEISYCWYDSSSKKNKGLLPYLGISEEHYREHYKRRVDKINSQVITLMDGYISKGIIKKYNIVYKNKIPQKIEIEFEKKKVAKNSKKSGRKTEKNGNEQTL